MENKEGLKQRIQNGETIVSLRVPIEIERGQLEDALAKAKYDLIYIDGQHAAFSDEQLVTFCATAEDLGIPVQMRLPHTRYAFLCGRYMDLGLSGVLVPEVMEGKTVEEAVAASYYPQMGTRSWGGAARYGLGKWQGEPDRLEYAAWWNDHVVVGIQLESVEAISNAFQLIRPGVDYFAFGPNDLMFSLEGHPKYPLQDVHDCMRNVADQVKGTGIRLGMAITTTPEERGPYLDMGVTVFQEAPRS